MKCLSLSVALALQIYFLQSCSSASLRGGGGDVTAGGSDGEEQGPWRIARRMIDPQS